MLVSAENYLQFILFIWVLCLVIGFAFNAVIVGRWWSGEDRGTAEPCAGGDEGRVHLRSLWHRLQQRAPQEHPQCSQALGWDSLKDLAWYGCDVIEKSIYKALTPNMSLKCKIQKQQGWHIYISTQSQEHSEILLLHPHITTLHLCWHTEHAHIHVHTHTHTYAPPTHTHTHTRTHTHMPPHTQKAFRVQRRKDGFCGKIYMMFWKKSLGETVTFP